MSSDHTPINNSNGNQQSRKAESEKSVTIVGGPQKLFHSCDTNELNDLVDAAEPDAYFITDTEANRDQYRHQTVTPPTDDPLLNATEHNGQGPTHVSLSGIDVLVCGSPADLNQIRSYERQTALNPESQSVILSDLLEVKMDKDKLETYLDGRDAYVDALNPESLAGDYTHISGKIEAGYCHEWDGLLVRGAGSGGGHGGQTDEFLTLSITTSGQVNNGTISTSKLGILSIDGVGPTTAERLEEYGLTTVDAIANSSISDLLKIDGFAETKAERTMKSATAVSDGTIVPTSDKPVPGNEPVFIDIETDGLNPTAVWLIGVKDGVDGNYMSFITKEPAKPGKAVKAFIKWFKANASNRTLLAWNGWNFDYPVLREHIQNHAPEYLDTWKRASKRDPLRWARDLDNAVMPGRTNKLEHVAEGLGWNGYETGLSGGEVARQYRQWATDPCPDTELDWDRHKMYCQGDVDALESIYTALCDASRIDTTGTPTQADTDKNTVQGSLFGSYTE